MKKIVSGVIFSLFLGSMLMFTGCSKREQGTAIGGIAGAAVGGAVGKNAGSAALGAIGGGALGYMLSGSDENKK